MDEIDGSLAADTGRGSRGEFPLIDRTNRERWEIPASLREPLVARLSRIIRDPNTPHREVLSAVSAVMTASKINLANIDLTIKVQQHEELERRMAEIERRLDAKKRREADPQVTSVGRASGPCPCRFRRPARGMNAGRDEIKTNHCPVPILEGQPIFIRRELGSGWRSDFEWGGLLRLRWRDSTKKGPIESFGSSMIDRPTLAQHHQRVFVRESQVRR